MGLCKELEPYAAALLAQEQEKPPTTTSTPASTCSFSNPAYYYLHQRLMDFLHSRDLVSQQISQVGDT